MIHFLLPSIIPSVINLFEKWKLKGGNRYPNIPVQCPLTFLTWYSHSKKTWRVSTSFMEHKPLLLTKKRGHDKCVLPVSKMSTLKYNGVSSDVKNSDSQP